MIISGTYHFFIVDKLQLSENIIIFFFSGFFEQVAEEARIDANMPVIMKNAVYAKKAMAKKARSQQLEQSRQEKAKSLGKILYGKCSYSAFYFRTC